MWGLLIFGLLISPTDTCYSSPSQILNLLKSKPSFLFERGRAKLIILYHGRTSTLVILWMAGIHGEKWAGEKWEVMGGGAARPLGLGQASCRAHPGPRGWARRMVLLWEAHDGSQGHIVTGLHATSPYGAQEGEKSPHCQTEFTSDGQPSAGIVLVRCSPPLCA